LNPDPTARFNTLVAPHLADALAFARWITRDRADAEDVVQEACVRAFRSIDRFSGSNAKAWLLTILRHAHVDRARARHGNGEISLDALGVDQPAPATDPPEDMSAWGDPHRAMAGFSDQEVILALKRVPEEIRWTLLLVDVQGMDDREAAEVLGVPVGTIKSRLHRGRRMLREYLLPVAIDRRLFRALAEKENANR